MAHFAIRSGLTRVAASLMAASAGFCVAAMATSPHASAAPECGDIWSCGTHTYLINVTVRPGYNFPNAEAALAYGDAICEKVASGWPYGLLVGDVKADFNTSDEYQAQYLINQALDGLCPGLIWQLRNSARHYAPPPVGS